LNSPVKKYHTSGKADRDITDIYKYTARAFGFSLGDKYLAGLYACFEMLGAQPDAGHVATSIRKTTGGSNMKAT
jgi:plasmid stabilization system protein ParE